MEVEKESFLKLKNLEKQLIDLIDNVDNEINKVNVEWLNLRSIALQQQGPSTSESRTIKENPTSNLKIEKQIPQAKPHLKENEIDLSQWELELNPRANQKFDEEFDSDDDLFSEELK